MMTPLTFTRVRVLLSAFCCVRLWPLLLLPGWAWAAAVYPTFSRADLESDFDRFRTTIEQLHPLYHADRAELTAAMVRQRAELRDGMTELEFVRVLAPVLRRLNCGHSNLNLSSTTESATMSARRYVPFNARVVDGRLWALDVPANSVVSSGAEVLSINGRTAAEIIATLYDRLPADGQNVTRKRHYLNYDFARAFYLWVDDSDTYAITYRNAGDDTVRAASLAGLSPTDWDTLPGPWWARNLRVGTYEFFGDYAYLYIKDFNFYSAADHVVFENFVDTFFADLKARGTTKLLLDVRGNGGGDPYMGAHLLSYLIDRGVPYFAANSDLYADLKSNVAPQPNRFTGQLVTLVDGGVFSTNGHFCSLLKYHHIGRLVGEETGGSFATTSNNLSITLVHTRLRFSFATDTFITAVSGLPAGSGVFPDVEVPLDFEAMMTGYDAFKAAGLRELGVGGASVSITRAPAAATVRVGESASLLVRVEGAAPFSYRWRKDGAWLPEAREALLNWTAFSAADAGRYDVLVHNAVGKVASATVELSIGNPDTGAARERLANLSSRCTIGAGDAVTVSGFVLAPGAARRVLIRGVGPALRAWDVEGVVSAPVLELYRGSTRVARNESWLAAAPAALREVSAQLGAFALPETGEDCAILVDLDPGLYTVHLRDGTRKGGVGLIEIYDAGTGDAGRLLNVSTQADVDAAGTTLVSGLVIDGDDPRTVLVRGAGPSLGDLGVPGTAPRVSLSVYAGAQELVSNAGWTGAALVDAAARVGAFPLEAGSGDAALLVTLPPGVYTIEARAAAMGQSGRVLAEVYEVPFSAP